VTTVERAFEIARSGAVRTIDDIRARLNREGFEGVQAHLSGATLKRQLKALMDSRRT
jgi:hypothetical protein